MRSVWAIARNTIAQAIRMKIALVIVIMLLILLPLMSVITTGDGTLKGKLQTFMSYGLSLTSLLLCLLTIIISTYTLSNDLKRKHIHLVATKPIRRFQILCGKLIGVIVLDIFLLTIFALVIYGLTVKMPTFSKSDQEQIAQAKTEFFTARISLTDPVDEEKINARAMQAYEKLEKSDQLPGTMTKQQIISELRGQERLKARTVEVGERKIWEFENVRLRDPNDTLFVRYKFEVSVDPPDSKVYGTWLIGDYRQEQYGPGNWKTPLYRLSRSDIIRTPHEFEVPSNAVTPDGYLAVVFNNTLLNKTTVIPEDVEVLLKAGSFTGNYIRVVLVILARLIFLAALGISVSAWLSFPVAILVCMVVFFIGTINGFIVESFQSFDVGATIIYNLTVRQLLWSLPRFDGDYNPTQFMISAKLLSWSLLMEIYFIMVFIKSVLLLLFGIWIFSNREIARIHV